MRSNERLRDARRAIFDTFPFELAPASVVRYQEVLADEILRSEAEKRAWPSPAVGMHLHRLRVYGDALAHMLLSRYAIRQLARNPGRPPALTGQGKAFSLVIETAYAIAADNVCPLVADLTHSIRNGDVIACEDPHRPRIIECKTSKPKREYFERQGRRGRQLARRTSIDHFLREGHGVIFGEDHGRDTLELTRVPEYSWTALDRLARLALDRAAVAISPQPGELISVAYTGESIDAQAAVLQMGIGPGGHAMIGTTSEALSWSPSDVPPPICWEIAPEARWALMEGEIAVTHVIHLETLIGFTREDRRITAVVEVSEQIPWRFEVMIGDEIVSMSATLARDVVYCHKTMTSAAEEALDAASEACHRKLR